MIEHRTIAANGIHLHVALDGPEDGQPILLLHGFPEFWYGWRGQIPYLAEKGFRVIAPDQRGYNLSDKPDEMADYRMKETVADAVALMDALGYEQFNLAGHDWGGGVAWSAALRVPEKIRKLAILNSPHPVAFLHAIQNDWEQVQKSWYMFYFQMPFAPEAMMSQNNWENGLRFLKSLSPQAFSEEETTHYIEAWSQPGAYTAMLNWYRAMMQAGSGAIMQHDPRVKTPTLILWGMDDPVFTEGVLRGSAALCDNARLVEIPGVGHWVQHEAADLVNRELAEFFAE